MAQRPSSKAANVPAPGPVGVDRNLALEVVRVTEASALAAAKWIGRGDARAADEAALAAMKRALNVLMMTGVVANGEGVSPDVPLHTGEEVGAGGGPKVDIALFALEGRTICAKGGHNALSLVALTDDGGFLRVPDDMYMEKLAVGAGLPEGILDLDLDPAEMTARIAEAKGIPLAELTVCVLDRPRHGDLIGQLYKAGVRVVLIDDGDVSGAIATGLPNTGIDLYMGSGGAAQGVLAAAGLKCLRGQMQTRFLVKSDEARLRLRRFSDAELGLGQMTINDLVTGDVMLAATGVTDGHLLKGVTLRGKSAECHSLVMRSSTGTIRWLTAHHDLSRWGAHHAPGGGHHPSGLS